MSLLRDQTKLWEPPVIDFPVIAASGRFTTDAVSFIEKHNEGVKSVIDSEAMVALEAYIMWSHKGTIIDPGTH